QVQPLGRGAGRHRELHDPGRGHITLAGQGDPAIDPVAIDVGVEGDAPLGVGGVHGGKEVPPAVVVGAPLDPEALARDHDVGVVHGVAGDIDDADPDAAG